MKKAILLGMFWIILFNFLVVAQGEHDFSKTKQLIGSGISCDKLTNEQLEEIGDYYMEQMHPGESHEMMDKMMGGEGSESLKQVHINMAKTIYCGKSNEMVGSEGGISMMPMMNMMNKNGMGMMDSNMMTGNNIVDRGNMMYGGYGSAGIIFSWITYLLLIALIIAAIYWLIKSANRKNEK